MRREIGVGLLALLSATAVPAQGAARVAAYQVDAAARAALLQAAPTLDPTVFQAALSSAACAQSSGAIAADAPPVLAVIDFSLPSTEPRLWVLDLASGEVLLHSHVSHGQATGDDLATTFSNTDGSHMSSLGLYRTDRRYQGKHGLSLRLDGLDEGLNDRARQRAIVVHGADYAEPEFIDAHGRLGRSWGCPAVARGLIEPLVESIEGGAALYVWHPDEPGLSASKWAQCSAVTG